MHVESFLTALAVKRNVASSVEKYAPNAIVFLYRQILTKGFGWLEGIERAKKPARRPVVFTRDDQRAVPARLDGVRRGMASRLCGSGLPLMEDAGCASGASIGNKTRSRDPGFDFKLLTCGKIAREQYATLAPPILGDRGVLLGRQYASPSHGVTAFHRRTASDGRSTAAAYIESAGAAGTGV